MNPYAAGAIFVLGFLAAFVLVASDIHGTADSCRASYPGYDCGIGWVKTDAFK